MELLLIKSIKENATWKNNLEKRVEKEYQKIAERIKRENEEMDNEIEIFMAVGNTLLAIMEDIQRYQRSANENHDRSAWEKGYRDWSNKIKNSSGRFRYERIIWANFWRNFDRFD